MVSHAVWKTWPSGLSYDTNDQILHPNMYHGHVRQARAVMQLAVSFEVARGGKTLPAFSVHAQLAILRIWYVTIETFLK